MSLKGTKTEANVANSFIAECEGYTCYTFYASKAKKEGYEQISAIFLETAQNEKVHAKIFLKFLENEGATIPVNSNVPNFKIGSTLENLIFSADKELEGCKRLPEMGQIAESENLPEIATFYKDLLSAEQAHEARFRKLAKQVQENAVFKRSTERVWKCRNCGYLYKGTEAPKVCPVGKHPQAFFELQEQLE